MIARVGSLRLSVAVPRTYTTEVRGPRCEAAVRPAAYMQALDLEERSALAYAELAAGSSSVGGQAAASMQCTSP